MIILEGPDNSGKSTLAQIIQGWMRRITSQHDRFIIIESRGKPNTQQLYDKRVLMYLSLPLEWPDYIAVRHPLISQPIYGWFRQDGILPPPFIIDRFYSDPKNLIIYCDPQQRGLTGHLEKAGVDLPEHLTMLQNNYLAIRNAYRKWAIDRAHIVYRIGDSTEFICRVVETFLSSDIAQIQTLSSPGS